MPVIAADGALGWYFLVSVIGMESCVLSSQSSQEELYSEILRLQKEIDEVNQHKIQAAEYGLAVLQEKQSLQEQLEQLELINEHTSTELQHLKQVER